jgi:hypothetical protein
MRYPRATTRENDMSACWTFGLRSLLAASLLAAAACGPLTVQSDPDTFAVPAGTASQLRGPQTVALGNAYAAETRVTIYPGGPTWNADLKQYTDTAITMLGREMDKQGIKVASPAAKSVKLRVLNVQASPGWVIRSSLEMEAEYGDGTKSMLRTENSSPSDAWRAVNGALMYAVARLLVDEAFLAYVNR